MTAATKVKYGQVDDTIVASNLYRQAIINGNFDIWQRGTSSAVADATVLRLADKWEEYSDKNGGTAPTLTRSRQAQTAGALAGSFYFNRLATNGAGTSLGASSLHQYLQKIEYGTRFLCGASRTITVSFYAKSDIASKKLGFFLLQDYGTGGSPTAQETINGTNVTLTSSWVKYTQTFTTNTLSGKTFGTNNDDYVGLNFYYMWGSSKATPVGAAGAETYVGSGNIDIAQVQLCAGSVALPFMPKSYDDELRACQRYCWRPVSGASDNYTRVGAYSSNAMYFTIYAPVVLRTTATISGTESTDWTITNTIGVATTGFTLSTNSPGGSSINVIATKTSHGLTEGSFRIINTGLIFSAEL